MTRQTFLSDRSRAPSILVIDPNAYMRKIVSDLLLQIGIVQIVLRESVDEARLSLASEPPGVIIVNSDCGALSGTEMTTLLRRGEFLIPAETPVIIMVSELYESQLQDVLETGIDEVLVKPVSLMALRARIEQVVFHRRTFIRSRNYIGPCRRRRSTKSYGGPWRRLGDDISQTDAGAALSMKRLHKVVDGILNIGWNDDQATRFTARDLYRTLNGYMAQVREAGCQNVVRLWISAMLYLEGVGTTASQDDLALIREHLLLSHDISGKPIGHHTGFSGRVEALEDKAREAICC